MQLPLPLLNRKEVAKILDCSLRSVDRFTESGELKVRDIAGVKIAVDDLIDFMEARRRPSLEEQAMIYLYDKKRKQA